MTNLTLLVPSWRNQNWNTTIIPVEYFAITVHLRTSKNRPFRTRSKKSLFKRSSSPDLLIQLNEFHHLEWGNMDECFCKPKILFPSETITNLAVSLDIMFQKIRQRAVDMLVMNGYEKVLVCTTVIDNRRGLAVIRRFLQFFWWYSRALSPTSPLIGDLTWLQRS